MTGTRRTRSKARSQERASFFGPLLLPGVLVSVLALSGGCDGMAYLGAQSLEAGGAISMGGASLDLAGDDSGGTVDAMNGGGGLVEALPPGFTEADVGGYRLGPAISLPGPGVAGAAGAGFEEDASGDNCGNVLLGEVRDFRGKNESGGHPDFEVFTSQVATPRLVSDTLGVERKPVYASECEAGGQLDKIACPHGPETTTRANFDEWYRNTPGTNSPYLAYFWFQPQPSGLFLFNSTSFFPLDQAGFGDTPGVGHNCLFTTELHTRFKYSGGETFEFTGDDDVWVFINGTLAVDLGGVHERQGSQVDLDASAAALGIVPGHIYALDLFQADRHTAFSTFRILTNLAFVNCGYVQPEVVK